jgi:hypothetical protein
MRTVILAIPSVGLLIGLVNFVACAGDPTIRVPYSPSMYDCSKGELETAPTLIAVSGGAGGGAPDKRSLLSMGGYNPSPAEVISDPNIRRRAAMICACRAKSARESPVGGEADALTVLGGVGTIGGGVVSGIAAGVKDDDKRAKLGTVGAISLGVGAVAFGLNTALNLSGRAKEHSNSATQQEQAAAVLLNNNAQPASWGEAWLACTSATDGSTVARRDDPQNSFSAGGSGGVGGTGGGAGGSAAGTGGSAGGSAAGAGGSAGAQR